MLNGKKACVSVLHIPLDRQQEARAVSDFMKSRKKKVVKNVKKLPVF